jgi:multiple RNA-binding domain-containing protein 1
MLVCYLTFRYGVNRSDILDTNEGGGEMAVRLAIGEAHVIQENRDYFSAHGVDLAALESSSSTSKAAARSNTTLLIKNLPHDVVTEELESMFSR